MRLKQILNEAPTASFTHISQPELKFLEGFIDLGTENFNLDDRQKAIFKDAFLNAGVIIPGTNIQLRRGKAEFAIIEPAVTGNLTLPDNWKQCVLTLNGDHFTWIGKRVRPEQYGKVDFSLYEDKGEGWVLIQTPRPVTI